MMVHLIYPPACVASKERENSAKEKETVGGGS